MKETIFIRSVLGKVTMLAAGAGSGKCRDGPKAAAGGAGAALLGFGSGPKHDNKRCPHA
ncbi:hypothetical protein Pssp01_25860 [Pseudomonas sp. NBRC 100443]|nr:hypothetical protein Pssp01_25860 [Pseudomonas sp. NBRC 100443]